MFNSLTRLLSEQIGTRDILSRMDIQTLALLMPDTSIHKARQFYQRLLAAIGKQSKGAGSLFLKVTFGLATLEREDENGWDLITRATREVRSGAYSDDIVFYPQV